MKYIIAVLCFIGMSAHAAECKHTTNESFVTNNNTEYRVIGKRIEQLALNGTSAMVYANVAIAHQNFNRLRSQICGDSK